MYMNENWLISQKFLLIEKLKNEKLKDGSVSSVNKSLIDFFYKYQYMGFHEALKEFNRMK